MKKLALLTMIMCVSLLMAGSAQATMLNFELSLPDILSDQTGSYSYDADSNLFTSSATPIQISFDGVVGNEIPIVKTDQNPKTYLVKFLVDESGNFQGGVSGNDLEIWGNIDVDGNGSYEYSGLLLAGEVTDFGWRNIEDPYDSFNFTFDVVGGALVDFYTQGTGGDVMFAELSDFDGDFTEGFGSDSKVKHDTAPMTPEPTSLLLLSGGLLGLAAAGMRKKRT